MPKNFGEVSAALGKEKRNVVKFCQEVGLCRVTKCMQALKELVLSVFFSVKTHKNGVPFRAIVSEKDSWRREVARFLQFNLDKLAVNDRF